MNFPSTTRFGTFCLFTMLSFMNCTCLAFAFAPPNNHSSCSMTRRCTRTRHPNIPTRSNPLESRASNPIDSTKLYGFFNLDKWNHPLTPPKEEEKPSLPETLSHDILKYAHDPILFEKAVMEQRKKQQQQQQQKEQETDKRVPTTPYQRIEEWEEQKQQQRKEGSMSWEERVQFEGLRDGNQLRQNEILRHHLKSY